MESGPIPLDLEPSVAHVAKPKGAAPFCSYCERPLAPDATICTGCGFDRVRGSRVTPVRPEDESARPKYMPRPCHECGYDLNGVVNAECPECGTTIRRGRYASLTDEARSVARASYLKALIGSGVGLVLIVLCAGISGAPRALLGTAMVWPLSIVGYAMAKVFWDGLDEPLKLLSIRSLAVLSVTVAAAILLLPISPMTAFRPRGMGSMILIIFAAVCALDSVCEEDIDDAVAYAIPFVVLGAFGPELLASLVLG